MKPAWPSGVILYALLFLTGCDEVVVRGVDVHVAPRAVLQLSASGIEADYRVEGSTADILVPAGSRVAALKVLEAARLLPAADAERSIESTSLLSGREESALRVQRARSDHVEDALEHVPGVIEARVLLHDPADELPTGVRSRIGSAAVLLLVDKERFATEPEKVSALVGGATGLPVDRVTVVLNPVEVPRVVSADRAPQGTGRRVGDLAAWVPAAGVLLVIAGSAALLVPRRWGSLRRRVQDEAA